MPEPRHMRVMLGESGPGMEALFDAAPGYLPAARLA